MTSQRRHQRAMRVLAAMGRARLAMATSKPLLRVTTSHGVFEENVKRFAHVIDAVGERCEFLAPQEYFAFLEPEASAEVVRNSLLMTFDDGLLSSYEFIMSELTPRGIRVIVFIPTAVVRMTRDEQLKLALRARFGDMRSPVALREEQYLTMGADEIRALVRAGHSVMPHSHTHACLARLATAAELSLEIAQPKEVLGSLVPDPVTAFAFPYGHHKALSVAAYSQIKRAYQYCFTGIGGSTTRYSEVTLLPRDNLDQSFDHAYALAITAGALDWYNGFRSRQLKRRLGVAIST